MDRLYDTVRTNGSVLNVAAGSEAGAPPSTGQLAAAAGTPPPSGPVQAATLGATPSQAKMAATPQGQKGQANALLRAVRGKKDLATTLREQQVSSQQTAAEKAAADWAAKLGSEWGSFANAVPGMIKEGAAKAAAAAAGDGFAIDPTALAGITPQGGKTLNDLKEALTHITTPGLSADDTKKDLDTINTALGYTAGNQLGSVDALFKTNLFTAGTPSVADATAEAIGANGLSPDQVNLSLLVDKNDPTMLDLGNGAKFSYDQLAKDLGLKDGAAVQALTIPQLQAQIQQIQAKGFQSEAQLRATLSDPTSSMQARSAARSALEAMGAQGVGVTEQKVASLVQSVGAANTVTTPDGTQMQVADVLGSPHLAAVVKDIIANPTGPTAQSPEFASLVTFAQDHQAALTQALGTISADEQAGVTTYTNNVAAIKPLGTNSAADFLAITGVDVNSLTTGDVTKGAGANLISVLSSPNMTSDNLTNFQSAVGLYTGAGSVTGKSDYPWLDPKSLANLSYADLSKDGFLSADGLAAIKRGLDASAVAQTVQQNIQPDSSAVIKVLGADVTPSQMQTTNSTLNLLKTAGVTIPGMFSGGVTVNGLTASMKGQPPYDPTKPGTRPPDYAKAYTDLNNGIADALDRPENAGIAAITTNTKADGTIDWGAATAAAGANVLSGGMAALDQLSNAAQSMGKTIAGQVMTQVQSVISGAVNKQVQDAGAGAGGIGSLASQVSNPASVTNGTTHGQVDQVFTTLLAQYGDFTHLDQRVWGQVTALYNQWQTAKGIADGTIKPAQAPKAGTAPVAQAGVSNVDTSGQPIQIGQQNAAAPNVVSAPTAGSAGVSGVSSGGSGAGLTPTQKAQGQIFQANQSQMAPTLTTAVTNRSKKAGR